MPSNNQLKCLECGRSDKSAPCSTCNPIPDQPLGPEGSLPTEPQTQAVTGATSTAEDKSSGPILEGDGPTRINNMTGRREADQQSDEAVSRSMDDQIRTKKRYYRITEIAAPDQPSVPADEVLTARAIVIWLAKQEPEIRKMGFASVALEALEGKIARSTQQAVVAVLEGLKYDLGDDPIWVYKIMETLNAAIARAKAGGE